MPNPTDIFGNLGWLNKWVKNLLGRVRALEIGGGGTTPGIDDVLAQGQALTASRNIDLNNQNLTINDDSGNSVRLSMNESTGETSLEGSNLNLKASNSLTVDLVGAGVLRISNAQPVPSGTAPNTDIQLPVDIDGIQYYIQLYKV